MNRKLIVGLGNPGSKYKTTRHNVGFMILDKLAEKHGVKFETKEKLEGEICKVTVDGNEVILLKSTAFMNQSGAAVRKTLQYNKILITNLLIIHDDIDLPLGKIKRGSGGSAGHKGVESVISNVESIINAVGYEFQRLRVGIENRPEYRIPPTDDYVLQNFSPEELQKFNEEIIPLAMEEIHKWLKQK